MKIGKSIEDNFRTLGRNILFAVEDEERKITTNSWGMMHYSRKVRNKIEAEIVQLSTDIYIHDIWKSEELIAKKQIIK